jgi:hypothetical protein
MGDGWRADDAWVHEGEVAAHQSLIVDPNKPIPFASDLAVEVASPSQSTGELKEPGGVLLPGC